MVEIQGPHRVASVKLASNNGRRSAVVTFVGFDGEHVVLTCNPCDELDLVYEAWKSGGKVRLDGNAAECNDNSFLLASVSAIRNVV